MEDCFKFCGLPRKANLYHSSNSPSFETAIPIILSYFHIDLVIIRQLLSIVSFGKIPKWDIIWYPFFIPSASWWSWRSILFTPGFLGWFAMIKSSVFSTFFCVFIHFIIVFAERKRQNMKLFTCNSQQKYSRLRCLLRVKGLVICFYLGWSGSTLLITKHVIKVDSKS